MDTDNCAVILHLEVKVSPDKRDAFLAFCKKAFPIYESTGGCKMALYEDRAQPSHFDEVGYYASEEDYERSEKAIEEDPVQRALLEEWKSLLAGPPTVRIDKRVVL